MSRQLSALAGGQPHASGVHELENRSVGFGITGISLLVAVVAVAFRNGSTVAAVDVPPVAALAVQRDEARTYPDLDSAVAGYDRGRELLAEYFGTSWESLTTRPRGTANTGAAARRRIPLRVTVAAIPDPFDSYLDWAYDANLEAMRRAFDAAGLRSYAFWLPQRTDSLRVTQDGVSTRAPAHDFQPGVMLFRAGAADSIQLHLLYLVPEVPTAGLHPMAFRAALRERETIMTSGQAIFDVSDRERAELSILGPNFSGSAISLRAMIDSALFGTRTHDASTARPTTVRMVSGTATAFGNLRTLSDTTRITLPGRESTALETVERIRFSATVNPDEAMDEMVWQLMDGIKLKPHQVALLTESGTGYGAGRVAVGPGDSATGGNVGRYLTVPFPLNIGSLRRAFEQSDAKGETGSSIPGLGEAPRTRLSFDERARGRETPNLLSDLSVPALDVVLGSLIRTLNEHDVRLVIIKATDVRDKMMLARELRRGLPDVLLVVYEGHVLLRRAEYSDALRGAVVVSSYPLALENQFWSTSHRREKVDSSYTHLSDLLAFPTDASIGVYNAALTLLDRQQDRVEFSMHSGLGSEQELRLPPVWMSVVGRDGFYPLRAQVPDRKWWSYLGIKETDRVEPDTHAERLHEHNYTHDDISLSFLIVVPMLLVTALLTTFLVGRDALLTLGLNVPRTLSRPDSARESLFLAIFLLSLVAAYLPFSVAVDARRIIASLDPNPRGASVALWIVMILSASVCLVALWLLGNGLLGVFRSQRIRGSLMGTEDMRPPPRKEMPVSARFSSFLTAIRAPSHVTREIETVTEAETAYQFQQLTTRQENPRIAKSGAFFIAIVSLLFLVCSVVFTGHLIVLSHDGGVEATLSMYRAMHLGSGVSPLVPLVILGLAFAMWSWWQLQQARTFDHHDPFESGVRLLAHAEKTETIWRRLYRGMVDARRGLSWMAPGLGVAVMLAVIGAVAWLVQRRRLASLEVMADLGGPEHWFDGALWIGILAVLFASCLAIYRLLHTWHGLQRFLDIIAGTPLANAFARLPKDVANITELGFFGSHRDGRDDATHAEELWLLAQEQAKSCELSGRASPVTVALALADDPLAAQHRFVRVKVAFEMLRDAWEATRTRPNGNKDVPLEENDVPKAESRALRAMEEYAAYEVVLFVERYLSNLRRIVLFLFTSLLILVGVGAQYPYQPRSVVSLATVVLLVATVASVFGVMFSLSRNETISRITRTEPGKVTWDTTFILNAVTFGVIPLLALVSSEFPAVRSFLFSWAEPLVRAVART